MKTFALAIAALTVTTAFLAAAPVAEARQVCTNATGDWTCPGIVCVWNRLEGRWTCIEGCLFHCWDPILP